MLSRRHDRAPPEHDRARAQSRKNRSLGEKATRSMFPRNTTVRTSDDTKIAYFMQFHSWEPSQVLYSTRNLPNLTLNIILRLP